METWARHLGQSVNSVKMYLHFYLFILFEHCEAQVV